MARAHSCGIKIIGATLTPFGNRPIGQCLNRSASKSVAVNSWIRGGGADGVADFDQALRDPEHRTQMLPSYDCGDGLNPSDAGYNQMGDAIDGAVRRRGAEYGVYDPTAAAAI
jgi:hypothetical protein